MKKIESIKEFGGTLERHTHHSEACQCEMTFSIYLPSQAQTTTIPALYWLSGLTCTDENFRAKAGAQRYAAGHGIALVMPDTSPRGKDVPDYPGRYDLGMGAGFYIDATQSPWSKNYKMYTYVVWELPSLIERHFPVVPGLKSIAGHSMGGHGALICALKNPSLYRSVSAFSPISNPTDSAWGKGVFSTYLGTDESNWQNYDAVSLIQNQHKVNAILVDQGTKDEFLEQLQPEKLARACNENNLDLNLRMQLGYDHGYHFVSSFIGEHIAYHAKCLGGAE